MFVSRARSHARMSARCPVSGLAQCVIFRTFDSCPPHQYSLTTISLQPRFPVRVSVWISSVTPCLGPVKLCLSRSHSTPSNVQQDRFAPGLDAFITISKARKKEGLARFLIVVPTAIPRFAMFSQTGLSQRRISGTQKSSQNPPPPVSWRRSHQPSRRF
jgi:hypothetical protein